MISVDRSAFPGAIAKAAAVRFARAGMGRNELRPSAPSTFGVSGSAISRVANYTRGETGPERRAAAGFSNLKGPYIDDSL